MKLLYYLTMKNIFFSLLLVVSFLHADDQREHRQLPYPTAMEYLATIKNDAIVLGSGKTEVHVFVDPLCPYSRKFISMVSRNGKMLAKYRYYIYLYGIPRLHSEDVTAAIYRAANPAETLLRVMVDQDISKAEGNKATRRTVSEISAVAEKLDVYKRPYLIVAEPK